MQSEGSHVAGEGISGGCHIQWDRYFSKDTSEPKSMAIHSKKMTMIMKTHHFMFFH